MPEQPPQARAYFVAVPPVSPEPVSEAVIILIDVGAFIAGLLNFCSGWQNAVQGLAQAEQVGFNNTAIALAWMAGYAEGLFKPLASIFEFIWKSVIVGLITKLIKALQALHKWLENLLGPLIKAIKQYQQSMQRLFNTYVKPILNVIQHVRRFLFLLRSLGIKWAGVLDSKLAKIEGVITGVFLKVASLLNGMVDILNALSDPLGLLRRPTLLLSLRRVFNSGVTMFTGLPVGYFFPSPVKSSPVGLGVLPANWTASNTDLNPPASTYLGFDDGLESFSGMGDGGTMPDETIDAASPLDYFNSDLYPSPACDDAVSCAEQHFQQQFTIPPVTA